MIRFLKKIEGWLDQKNEELDKKNTHLQFSKSKFRRFIWKVLFKPKSNLDFLSDSPSIKQVKSKPASRVIHVVNFVDPSWVKNHDLAKRIKITLESISRAKKENVILVGAITDDFDIKDISFQGWKFIKLNRNASILGSKIKFAFLKDMLSEVNSLAKEGDIIFYSNMDCPVHPDIYENLLRENDPAVEFIRKDVEKPLGYKDLLNKPFVHYDVGIDGLALKKELLIEFLKLLPDFIIGEPHWDTAASGILHKNFNVIQNLSHLYHIKHDQQWDPSNLTEAGKYNERLYRDCVNYGLMDDKLISIKKECLILLNVNDVDVADLISQLKRMNRNSNTVLYSEFSKSVGRFKKILTGINYLPIESKNKYVNCLDQTSTMSNLLVKRFSDHSSIIIFLPKSKGINAELVKTINLQLKTESVIQTDEYFAINPIKISNQGRIFNFYLDNSGKFPNINKYSFINDEGLLELFKNYGYFQPANMPV